MQNVSRDCHRRVLPGNRHSGRTLYAKAQSEPYAREEKYNSSGLTCHLKEAVRVRNSIDGYCCGGAVWLFELWPCTGPFADAGVTFEELAASSEGLYFGALTYP